MRVSFVVRLAELTAEDRERIRFMYLHTVRRVENIFGTVALNLLLLLAHVFLRLLPPQIILPSAA